MRTCPPAHLVRLAVVVLTTSAALAGPARAQTPGSIVGVTVGRVVNEHLWQPDTESDRVGGFVLGAFVNAATPAPWFSVHAEAAVTQRGGDVSGSPSGEPFTGGIRADYLTVSVHPRASIALGRVALHVKAGPSIDQVLRSRLSTALAPVLQEASMIFGISAGVGLSATVSGPWVTEVEARVVEGLGDAYSGPFVSARNRSFEFVLRVGRPLRR